MFFYCNGIMEVKNTDAATIIGEALRENQNALDGVSLTETRIQNYLADELSDLKINSPTNFSQWFDNLRHASVIIFGLQNGSLFIYHSDRVRVQVKRHDCPGKSCPPSGEIGMVFYGHSAGLDEYYRNKKPSQIDWDWVKKAMESAIEAEPRFVGPPIDIIRINKTGARWVQVKEQCK
jgi:hypothetical protein